MMSASDKHHRAVMAFAVTAIALMMVACAFSVLDEGEESDAAVTKNTYTLNFNANGGNNAPATMTKSTSASSSGFTIPETIPTRSGYTFLGWALSSNGDAILMPGDYFSVHKEDGFSFTLYAKWISGTFDGDMLIIPDVSYSNVDYVTYNGRNILKFEISHTVNVGVVHYEFRITKVGSYSGDYTLTTGKYSETLPNGKTMESVAGGSRIYIDDDDWPVGETRTYDTIAGAMSIVSTPSENRYYGTYLQVTMSNPGEVPSASGVSEALILVSYEPTYKYSYTTTVNFDANGGSNAPDNISKTEMRDVSFAGNETIVPGKEPTRSGFRFAGWSTSIGGSVAYEPGQDIVIPYGSTLNLYAVWEEPSNTVTFISNGNVYQSLTVPSGQTVTAPTDPSMYGFTFSGWYLDNTFVTKFDFSTVITSDMTLYARWDGNLEFTTEPTAAMNVTPIDGMSGAVLFDATGSSSYTSLVWDFGDGTTSTNTYVTHFYSQPGTYTATLTVYNNYGSDTTEFTIEVPGSSTDGLDYVALIAIGLIAVVGGGLLIRRIV